MELERGWTPFTVSATQGLDEEAINRPRRQAAINSVAVTAAVVNDSEEEQVLHHLSSKRTGSPSTPNPAIEEAKRLVHVLYKARKLVWPFEEPVENIPGYNEIVKRPMDLETILTGLREGKYNNSIVQFIRDVRQVFINAAIFNQPHDEIHRNGVLCSNLFEKKLSKSRIIKPCLPIATI
jgi:bromodomain-containing protein 7/9